MKNFFFTCLCMCVVSQTFSMSGINPGSSLSTGPSSNHFSLYSSSKNPGMAPLVVPDNETFRLNILPSVSFNVELGDVNNFVDDLDELIDLIEDPSANTDSATETLERFNEVLRRMGESGYLKQSAHVSVPLLPLYYYIEELNATFFLDASVAVQASVEVLDEMLRLADRNQGFTTDTSIYFKSGIEKKISMGLGREFFSNNKKLSDKGDLYMGATMHIIELSLSKQVTRLEDLDGQDVGDVIRDEYDNNLESTLGVSVDLGLVWDAEWYRAGLTASSVNSPKFSYGTIGETCGDRPENTIERNSCEVSRRFIDEGRLRAREEHTMHARLRADALLKITDRWFISSSLDLAQYDDIVGFENQWWNTAMTYDAQGKLLPAARIGFHKNLVGSKLASMTFGFTFFEAFAMDFEWGTQKVNIDGDSAPRRFGFALSFEESF